MNPPIGGTDPRPFAVQKVLKQILAVMGFSVMPGVAFAAGELPPLQPAHHELPPTFWEQHGWAVIIGAVTALVLLALFILFLCRSKPAVVVPPDVLARRALEALRGQEENGMLLMKVSGIFRHYVIFACGLPLNELTTAEVCQMVADRPQFTPDLAASVANFFRQCDERKFSPTPPASNLGAVDTALALFDKIEARRRQIANLVSASTS